MLRVELLALFAFLVPLVTVYIVGRFIAVYLPFGYIGRCYSFNTVLDEFLAMDLATLTAGSLRCRATLTSVTKGPAAETQHRGEIVVPGRDSRTGSPFSMRRLMRRTSLTF